jgi:hypothetical protein
MKHPANFQLALYAGGDLDFWDRWRVKRHISECDCCEREIHSLQSASAELRNEGAEMPEGLNWDRLSAEMAANIHLGLEAGECVGTRAAKQRHTYWRAAAVMAGTTFLLIGAWWLNPMPKKQQHVIRAAGIEIRTTSSGIELNENGNALTLLHTRGGQKPIIISVPGTLRARYVDNETGQVTINNVYTD